MVTNQFSQAYLQDRLQSQIEILHEENKQLKKEITERKLFEYHLGFAQEKMRKVLASINDIVIVINVQENQIGSIEIIPTNSSLTEISNADLASQTVEQLFQGSTAELWLNKILQALETNQIINFDYSVAIEKQELWFAGAISTFDTHSVIFVGRNITDSKKAEEALRQSEARERKKAQQLEVALVELQQTQVQLVMNEKMASLGQLVAGIAHEINNPTSFIYGNIKPAMDYAQDLLFLVELYQRYYPQPPAEISEQLRNIDIDFIMSDFPELLASMEEGTKRISQIVESLHNFSRLNEAKRKFVDIHQGIDNTLLFLQHRLREKPWRPSIQISKEYNKLPLVECCPSQLNQVFMNILTNAIDALEESGGNSISIRTYVTDFGVQIRIADNGCGMTKEVLRKIFDPFFTTKPPGKGTGLGLAVSYKIVTCEHGGQIECYSVPGQGTEFAIALPVRCK